LISSQPYIFSNGYHIKFNEKPCAECNIGYIVPEWVESTPSLSDIENIYGCSKVLPTTTIILPLKNEKVDAVKKQLSSLHPEMLLFLSKIRKLSVQEHNSDPKSSTISEIAISIENDFQSRKNMHAESYTLHLSAEETRKVEECGYYMWRQKFPVKSENKVEKRAEIHEWVITLAFPLAGRLSRKNQLFPGVYAFLPTEMVTNFPFIIQADFLLASSREAILYDSPWNKGILECVPTAFMNAFVTLVKSKPDAPAISIPSMFNFLPVNPSLISVLEPVRSGIKEKVIAEDIVPCESYTSQKIFCKASEVARLKPAFWTILHNALKFGVDLKNLSTHGTYILSSNFDRSSYDSVLQFLEVKDVGAEWYAKCIEGSNLVKEVDEQLYLDLLYFVTDNWQNYFSGTNMMSIPLLKYVNRNDVLSFWSISRASQGCDRLCIASEMEYMSWLISWNKEFPSSNRFFIQPNTQSALEDFSQKTTVKNWLQNQAKVEFVSVYSYASTVVNSLNDAQRPIISFAQFLYHSEKKSYIDSYSSQQLCHVMPVIDSYGKAVRDRNSIMVPAKGSKWVELMGTNPWRKDGYIELSGHYKSAGHFAGNYTSEDHLLEFLKTHLQVSDVPLIHPPNASFPAARSPLSVDNAFLLLEWIRIQKSKGRLPDQFLASVKEGRWLKTSLGFKPPMESFLSSAKWASILQNGSSFVDIPMIDQQVYGNKLYTYTDELKLIGVRFEFQEASAYIGSCLLSKDSGNALTRENVYSLLRLIRYLGEEFLSPVQLINSVKDGQWMKSTLGYRCPADCIICDSEWEVASHISNQSFLDVQFYGKDILQYEAELELLGVIVAFKENYELVIKNFKFSSAAITSEATTLILKCIRYVNQCEDFIRKLKDLKWLKTNVGFCAPNEIFLVDPEWECLLKVFDGTPVIDYRFYGSEIISYKEELKKIGLIMRFEEASKAITHMFKEMVSKSSLTKASVLALLGSYRQLRTHHPLPVELFNCMRSEKWLHTSLGFRSPSEAIFFNDTWQPLSPIANLPFIDDGDSLHGLGKEIYDYKDELQELGVTVEAKNGARFAISGLSIPGDPSTLTKATVVSLLVCIKNYFKSAASPPKGFEDKICMKWLKTSMGYQCPDECILFDAKQSSLCMEDGPFIDEAFYGSELVSFKDSLARIGVTVNVNGGQNLVAQHLRSHKVRTTISRIYLYLMNCNWKPNDKDKSSNWIWIPNEMEDGEWVSSGCCVLSDENNLFGQQIYVLDKYYDKELLGFFSLAFGVRHGPDAEDYCKLWSTWERSVPELDKSNCSAFWMFIATNWSKNTQKFLSGCVKVPVCIDGKITLSRKEDVFIPDDLLLTDLFKKLSQQSLFIWYPPSTIPCMSRARLNNIYDSIGVQRISKAVMKNDFFTLENGRFTTVNKNKVIKVGLLHIVLAFLADPALDIPTERRHRMVSCLLNVTVQEKDEPITVSYSVSLSSGEVVNVNASRMLRWERENSKLYIHSRNGQSSYKEKIEYATYFAEEISKGMLFEMPDQIPSLTELIKCGSLLDFDDAAVGFLRKSHNLQLFPEDEDFLNLHC
jgi:sacsin